MKFQVERAGEITIVRIDGNLMGGPEVAAVHDAVKQSISDGVVNFIVDLKSVPHMSSSGLGGLIACRASVTKAEGTIKLLKPASRIQEVLRITDLMRYFDCYNDEAEAIAAFGR